MEKLPDELSSIIIREVSKKLPDNFVLDNCEIVDGRTVSMAFLAQVEPTSDTLDIFRYDITNIINNLVPTGEFSPRWFGSIHVGKHHAEGGKLAFTFWGRTKNEPSDSISELEKERLWKRLENKSMY